MIKLNRILSALDFSSISEGAARFALQLARKRQAEIHLLTVDVIQENVLGREKTPSLSLEEVSERFRERSQRLVGEARVEDDELAVKYATVREHAPAPGIVQYAEEHEIDLIVTGTHGRRGVRRTLLGSVAAEVVRTAPAPVLTIRTGKDNPPEDVRKIVVPVDFSAPSRGAVQYGARLADFFGAQLYLIHAMEEVDDVEGRGFKPSAFGTAEGYRRVQEALRELSTDLAVEANPQVLQGRPSEEITTFAVDKGIDLVVMPTRGQSGWQRFLMGSVAEKVISTAPCPVLSAKDFEPYLQTEEVGA